jgi:ADP-ribosyl-[dinitrogen reductase] hydrolase
LARTLIVQGRYDAEEARKAYVFWLDSAPFDRGSTVSIVETICLWLLI